MKTTRYWRAKRLAAEREEALIHEWSKLAIIGGSIFIGLCFVFRW